MSDFVRLSDLEFGPAPATKAQMVRISNRMALDFCRERLNCPWIWKKQRVAQFAKQVMGITEPLGVYKIFEIFWDRYYGIDGIARQIDETGIVPNKRQPKPSKAPKEAPAMDVNADAFLVSYEWRRLRMQVIKERGARCECCGASPKDGVRMHVDHIKPRRRYPELALTKANLQVLCEVCNHGKGSWDETDWRADSHSSGKSSTDSHVTRSGDGQRQMPVVFPRLRNKNGAVTRDVRSD